METSAQEAVYLTLQMPLTKAARHVVFINTSPSDKRTFLLKQNSELEKLSPDSTEISSSNDIKRYRPKSFENWCLADYISQFEVKFPKNIDENAGKKMQMRKIQRAVILRMMKLSQIIKKQEKSRFHSKMAFQ